MATADLYYNTVDISTNNRPWSITFWLEEIDPISAGGDGLTVALAVEAQIVTALQAALSRDAQVERIVSSKRERGNNPTGRVQIGNVDGGQASDAMSNDNCWRLQFVQQAFAAKHNGGVNIAGIGEGDHNESRLTPGFVAVEAQNLADAFQGPYDAQSPESGRWRLVVFSKTIVPPTHDFGTAIAVTSVRVNSTILTQSARRQKVQGFAT